MCKIEEKVYISATGNQSSYENTILCKNSSRGRLCPKVDRRCSKYYPSSSVFSDNSSSLAPSSPITPTGSNTYLTEPRRPAAPSARPSTRDGLKSVKPEIVISIGNKSKKGGPSILISTTKPRNISSGSSTGYSDSDGSHTVRTGYPEEPHLPSYGSGNQLPTPRHSRHPSSGSSFTTSSGTPSYVSSEFDFDSLSNHAEPSYLRPLVHNPPPATAGTPPSPYLTNIVSPNYAGGDRSSPDGARLERSGSTRARSGPPREADRTHRRKRQEGRRRREDAEDSADENAKQVRFQLGREEMRAQLRDNNMLAEKDKRRAEHREDKRKEDKRKQTAREWDEPVAREPRREKTKQSTTEPKQPSRTRRSSMTSAQLEEQRRLIAAEAQQMNGERQNAEALEREEELYNLHEQQQSLPYYSTRTNPPVLTRRGSISAATPPPPLDRLNTRNVDTVQPSMPSATRADGSQRQHTGPPVSFYNLGRAEYPIRRPSSSHQEHHNPFSQASSQTTADSWDTHALHDALPNARYPSDDCYNPQRPDSHARAQQASSNLNRAFGQGGGFANE